MSVLCNPTLQHLTSPNTTGTTYWFTTLRTEQELLYNGDLGELQVCIGENALPAYSMELRPAGYMMKRGMDPSDAMPFK
jgi:hypothetical protein